MIRDFAFRLLPLRVLATLVRRTATVLLMSLLGISAHAQVLTSFLDAAGKHAFYTGNDFHVHQLYCASACNNVVNWANQDLTQWSGAPPVSNFNNYASFSDGTGEHVFFIDQAQHVHQLRFASGAWGDEDLGVVANSGLGGYSANAVARVFYESNAQHVHMLTSSNGTSWSDTDLTTYTGGTLAAWGGSLTSFNDGAGEHVFYVATNGHVDQLYGYYMTYYICFPPYGCRRVKVLRWVNQDLTAQTSGPKASTIPLSSYTDQFGEHVLYEDWNQHLHQLLYGNNGWSDLDLTVHSNGPVMYFGLSSFSDNFGEEVFYVAYNLNIYQPWNGRAGDLTTFAGAPLVYSCGGPSLTAFGESVSGLTFDDVFYVANDGNLHRISMQPGVSATDQNLTGGQALGALPRNFCIQ